LEDTLPDVLRETPKTESAALKMKRILGKAKKPVYEFALKVLTDVATEAAKNVLLGASK
jgi:hypothetical protein